MTDKTVSDAAVDGTRWIAAHMTDEQAAEALLYQFKRAVNAELDLLMIEVRS